VRKAAPSGKKTADEFYAGTPLAGNAADMKQILKAPTLPKYFDTDKGKRVLTQLQGGADPAKVALPSGGNSAKTTASAATAAAPATTPASDAGLKQPRPGSRPTSGTAAARLNPVEPLPPIGSTRAPAASS
jgi:hypothetical protein